MSDAELFIDGKKVEFSNLEINTQAYKNTELSATVVGGNPFVTKQKISVSLNGLQSFKGEITGVETINSFRSMMVQHIEAVETMSRANTPRSAPFPYVSPRTSTYVHPTIPYVIYEDEEKPKIKPKLKLCYNCWNNYDVNITDCCPDCSKKIKGYSPRKQGGKTSVSINYNDISSAINTMKIKGYTPDTLIVNHEDYHKVLGLNQTFTGGKITTIFGVNVVTDSSQKYPLLIDSKEVI